MGIPHFPEEKMIRDLFLRWRRSKGYGIHSPLAFRIVTECVRPPRGYAFYADDLIDAKYSGFPSEKRFARMYVRLANLVYPGIVRQVADKSELLRIAGTMADREEYTLVMPFGIEASEADAILPDATLLIRGRKFTIVARRRAMARVSYEVL